MTVNNDKTNQDPIKTVNTTFLLITNYYNLYPPIVMLSFIVVAAR